LTGKKPIYESLNQDFDKEETHKDLILDFDMEAA